MSGESVRFDGQFENPKVFEDYPADPETLRGVLAMLEEIKQSDRSTLDIIEGVLLDPTPDPEDLDAVQAYTAKMLAVRLAATGQFARAEIIEDIEARVQARLDQIR